MSGNGVSTGEAGERPRIALCLAGGGVTGAMYELGALVALSDLLGDSFDVCRFDIFVGTSAGANVAAVMACGVSPRRLFRAILDPADSFWGARRHDVFRFDLREVAGAVRDLARIALVHAGRTLRGRPAGLAEMSTDLEDALPSGLFSLRHWEKFWWSFFRRHGLPTRFDQIDRELYITANDLDTGHRVVFGEEGYRDVPLPLAMCASSAIPLFFEPVRIHGRDYIDGGAGKVEHVDVALRHGARGIIAINPMVPFRVDPSHGDVPTPLGRGRRIRDKGLLTVWEQAMRMNTKTKLHQALRRFRAERPDVATFLIEPDESETVQFMNNPMNFNVRREMLRFGYVSAAAQLRRRVDELGRVLAPVGASCDVARLVPGPAELAEMRG